MANNHFSSAIFTMSRLDYSISLQAFYLQYSIWVDNMVEQNNLIRSDTFLLALFSHITLSVPAMSYEEPNFKIIKKTDVYEVRRYERRTVAEVTFGDEDNSFRILFDYISGANKEIQEIQMTVPVTQSKEIDITAPVTRSSDNGQMVMRFFLPSSYSKQNAPKPTDKRVQIIDLPEEYFAVISYSGFASDSNFIKHHEELKAAMEKDGLVAVGPPLKATFNSPFTPPFLRRNEAMYLLKWN